MEYSTLEWRRKADIGLLQADHHRLHFASLPRAITLAVALQRIAAINIKQHFFSQREPLAKGVVPGHQGMYYP